MASWTGLPSSVNATTPASANSSISANSRPWRPLLMQPTGRTRTTPSEAALRCTHSTTEALPMAGWVLGMAHKVVKPPRAAARVPVAMVSLCS